MLDGGLHPRVRAALRLDTRAGGAAVTMGDTDLQFRGVPRALLADVVGRFTGHHTLDAVCGHYPGPVTRVIQLVATEMQVHGMLLLSREHCDEWPNEDALARGAATWRYVLDRVADPLAAWRRWRSDPVAVYGGGVSFAAAVGGLLDTGVGRLWIGPDTTADRDAVAGQFAEHAGCDGDFEWRWLDADDAVDPAALIVRVGDRPLADGSEDGRTHTGRRVIAGTTGRGGTVWRLAVSDGMPSLSGPADRPPLSHYALSVLGNMAAFQSLNTVLAEESTAGGALLPFGATVHIHPDGRFEAAATAPPKPIVGGAFVRAASAGPASPQQRYRERWIRVTRPFMAGTSPLLAWDDETPLPVFPLPHRALMIVSGEGDRPVRTVMWAVSPSDVTARALRHGLEALADYLEGVGGHAAATDEEEWRTRAYLAWAQAQAPVRLARWPTWRLDYDDTDDVEFRTLVRLVGLYLGESPRVGISLDPRSGLARADAAAGGHERFALATSPLAAAICALGALLSAYQLGAPPLADPAPATDAAAVCHLALTETVSVRPERLGLVPHMLGALNDVPLQDLLIGRFEPDTSDA